MRASREPFHRPLAQRTHAWARQHGDGAALRAEECVSSPRGLEEITDARELGRVLNGWLGSLPRQDCADFMRRYWGGESVADIAAKRGVSANALSQKFARMRKA
ncbi:MAG: hypothetical protein V8S87_03100 [Oscillospiraceae bacterium]